ncbi:diaminopimelate epimerase [Jeotgalibacillus malaysiensis]|uniref:Diaminopimelate epimerase n=1 Tax=Jeotgalibacillus malaysiensis TaxID=1508404 RepID=A0A0B5ARC8_9BACL|nr:diaminopimelate epimerase [Jeotgalibacillus malaysiensis]AJD91202.1 diaminopimelate epimerase [Jeotgalibacillus malaysiensis]
MIPAIQSHGSKNNFIIIDEKDIQFTPSDQVRAAWTIKLCAETHTDGILFISDSNRAQAKMRVFNSDGSEASMCGNGLRCAARYIAERDQVESFNVETMKAVLKVEQVDELYGDIPTFSVEISPVLFDLASLPLKLADKSELILSPVPEWEKDCLYTALAVPNPHIITNVSVDMINSDSQETLATQFNGENKWFSDGVNVSYVVELAEGEFFVRTFERGVGFTNACGTAMSSSSLVQVLAGKWKAGEPINIFNDGGRVKCVVHGDQGQYDHIDLIGNATFTHIMALSLKENGDAQIVNNTETNEDETYDKMAEAAKEHLSAAAPDLKLRQNG